MKIYWIITKGSKRDILHVYGVKLLLPGWRNYYGTFVKNRRKSNKPVSVREVMGILNWSNRKNRKYKKRFMRMEMTIDTCDPLYPVKSQGSLQIPLEWYDREMDKHYYMYDQYIPDDVGRELLPYYGRK